MKPDVTDIAVKKRCHLVWVTAARSQLHVDSRTVQRALTGSRIVAEYLFTLSTTLNTFS